MEITWLGAVLFPLGLATFLVAPQRLAYLAVFFIPFTASSTLNSASGVPLSPFQWFGALFIFYRFLCILNNVKFRLLPGGDRTIALLLLFMTVAAFSMIMPAIIDGKLLISSNHLNDLYISPVVLTDSNIKYPIPVIFGTLFAIFLAHSIDTTKKSRHIIRIYVISGVFVALWGILNFLCLNVLDIEYPNYLFNNIKLDSAQGFDQKLDINGQIITRISSVTHEPSILAKYLLTVIPIVMASVWLCQSLFWPLMDKVILVLLVAVLFLTTSTTGYFGFVVALLACALIVQRYRAATLKFIRNFIILCGGGVSLVLIFFLLDDILNFATLSKLESGSALERALSISNSWNYFIEYPILGVGWAIVTSHDLIVNLLVNTGVIGLLSFATLTIYLGNRSVRSIDLSKHIAGSQASSLAAMCLGFLVSFIVLIFTGVVSGLEFYLGYYYFVISMLTSINIIMRKQRIAYHNIKFGRRKNINGGGSESFT